MTTNVNKIISACLKGHSAYILNYIQKSKYLPIEYRETYDAILALQTSDVVVTPSTISHYIKSNFNKQADSNILATNEPFLLSELPIICADVIEDYFKNEYTFLASSCVSLSQQSLFDLKGFKKKYEKITSEYENYLASLSTESFEDIKNKVIEQIRAKNEGIEEKGITTNISDLDKYLGELEGGHIYIIAGRPAMGKTAVTVQLLTNMSVLNKHTGLYFSLEMTSDNMARRVLANNTGYTNFHLKVGLYGHKHLMKDFEEKANFNCDNIIMSDKTFDIDGICARIKREHSVNNIKYVIIDYIGLIQTSVNGTTNDKMADISRKLKIVSMICNIPIIVLSQLNRSVETRGGDKRPMLSDLRDSGAVEQDASVVMFLFRPEYYGITITDDNLNTKNLMYINIAKNREGALYDVKLTCDLGISKVVNFTEYNDPIG